MSYRNDVDALAARHDALAAEVAAKTRELEAAAQLLDDAKQRARLPVLPNIRVATPCRADWNEMTGDERVRACGSCNKNVYNLSSMTRDEAEALIVEKEGRLCVRYFQRSDGTILLKDCAVGVSQKRKRRIIAAGAAALLGGGGLLAYKRTRPERGVQMLGEMAPDEPRIVTTPGEQEEMLGQMVVQQAPQNPGPEWSEVKGDIAAPIEEGDVVQHGEQILVAPK